MKQITLSRHVVIKDKDGTPMTIKAGQHTLPADVVSKIETAAKDDSRTTVEVVKDLTPVASKQAVKIEAVKADQEK